MSGNSTLPTVPALRFQSAGDESAKFALRLTQAQERIVVRITGGCGLMTDADAQGLIELYTKSFVPDFAGAMLFGGTRMVLRDFPTGRVMGITEVVPHIRKGCPRAVTLGIVPRTEEMKLADYGLVVSDDPSSDYVTIVHPEQDLCLIVQRSADEEESWDAEWRECLRMMEQLREYAGWKSLLICYNGGSVTERELLAHAKRGWPVLLLAGSGRKTDEYAANEEFLRAHPSVHVADRSVASFRRVLKKLGVIPASSFSSEIITDV